MADAALHGKSVLVTRPAGQSAELVDAVQAAGGDAVTFPVIEIVPRHPDTVAEDAHSLRPPDITIFVSRNAVDYGLSFAGSGAICAIGPATASALEAAGRHATIQPSDGYDSEHLLAEPALQAVEGQTVRIIRGNRGRELIAETLRDRGATVEYLSVYERRLPDYDESRLTTIASMLANGEIDAITVMSIESLQNLVRLLPSPGATQLAEVPLVTPASRVIKDAHDRIPGSRTVLAKGPQASDMVRAIMTLTESGKPHD
jgi:uroporphyrinogen-III synthase